MFYGGQDSVPRAKGLQTALAALFGNLPEGAAAVAQHSQLILGALF
jgi:hypothetical protein